MNFEGPGQQSKRKQGPPSYKCKEMNPANNHGVGRGPQTSEETPLPSWLTLS